MTTGNVTKAALLAGYSERTARKQGSRLLTKGRILNAIEQVVHNDPAVWTREDSQRFWTAVARGADGYEKASLRDRLEASETLGRSQADFVERREYSHGLTLEQLVAVAGREPPEGAETH